MRDLYAVTAFRVSVEPGISASPADVLSFVALVVHRLGAIAMFRSPSEGPMLYLAVFEPRVGCRLTKCCSGPGGRRGRCDSEASRRRPAAERRSVGPLARAHHIRGFTNRIGISYTRRWAEFCRACGTR